MERVKPSPMETLAGFTASTAAGGGADSEEGKHKETIPLTTLPPLTDSSSALGEGGALGVTVGGGRDLLQKSHRAHSSTETSLGGGQILGVGTTLGGSLGGSDILQKIHTAHSSAETSGLGDSLQRLHTLSSTETSGYGGGAHSPTGPSGGDLLSPGALYSPELYPCASRYSPGVTGQLSRSTASQSTRLNPTDQGHLDGQSPDSSHQSPGTISTSPRRRRLNIKELSPRSKRQHFKSASRTLRYDGSETFDKYDQEELESDFKENLSASPVQVLQGAGRVGEVGVGRRDNRQSQRPCSNRSTTTHPPFHTTHTKHTDRRDYQSDTSRKPVCNYSKQHTYPHTASPHTHKETENRLNKGYVKRIDRREKEEQEEELVEEDDMSRYFERASNHGRGGSYTPIASTQMTSSSSEEAGSVSSLNRKSSLDDRKSSIDLYFLGRNTKSTWLAWSEERRESFKRRQYSIEQRQREMEQNRVPTPVRKARKESVMFVSPELEEQHIIRDELLEESERIYQQVGYYRREFYLVFWVRVKVCRAREAARHP